MIPKELAILQEEFDSHRGKVPKENRLESKTSDDDSRCLPLNILLKNLSSDTMLKFEWMIEFLSMIITCD